MSDVAAPAPGLEQVRGPSAMGGGLRRFRELTLIMALLEYKLRFYGSTLGYLWALIRPLALFGVLYVVFTQFVKLGAGVNHYPVLLLMGIVVFTFFSEGTANAVDSLVARETLVRKIHFPRLVIPTAVVLTAFFSFCLNLLVVFIFALASGVEPRWSWLELPVLMLLIVLLTAGAAMIVSALYVRYRDVKPIWEVALQVVFYASPVLYVMELVDRPWMREWLLALNPLAPILQQMRHALIDPDAASAATAMGGTTRLLIPIGLVLIVFAAGYRIFDRAAPTVAEQL